MFILKRKHPGGCGFLLLTQTKNFFIIIQNNYQMMKYPFSGNILILLAIFLNRDMQTPTNYFLASLAVADLLISMILPTLTVSHSIFLLTYISSTSLNKSLQKETPMIICNFFNFQVITAHFSTLVAFTTSGCQFKATLELGLFFVSVFHLTTISFER